MRTGLTLAINNDYQDLADHQSNLEAKALRLAAAWTDFDTVENIAGEAVRRFGSIDPRDFGVLRLHREPVFVAFQTAAVTGYVRPFIQGGGLERIAEKYSAYDKPEWTKLHDELLFWHYRLSGENSARERQFIVAPDDTRSATGFVIGEATPILEPVNHFMPLRNMCADRKALIWPDLQEALAACYPFIKHPVLLSRVDSF